MNREEYEERFNAVEKQIKLKHVSLSTGVAMIAVLAQQYQAAFDQKILEEQEAEVLKWKNAFHESMRSREIIEEGSNKLLSQLREMRNLVVRLWDHIPFGMAKSQLGDLLDETGGI